MNDNYDLGVEIIRATAIIASAALQPRDGFPPPTTADVSAIVKQVSRSLANAHLNSHRRLLAASRKS